MTQALTIDRIVAAYQTVASTDEGRIMLADLEARFGFTTRSMFDRDDMTGLRLAFREGSRSVLAHMGRMIETAPDGAERAET